MGSQSKLYLGDSSDDDFVEYNIDKPLKNAEALQNSEFLTSFWLGEVGQSILENKKIVAAYRKKKQKLITKLPVF